MNKSISQLFKLFLPRNCVRGTISKQGAIKYLYPRQKHWLDVKIKKKYDKAGRLSQKYGYFNLVTFSLCRSTKVLLQIQFSP